MTDSRIQDQEEIDLGSTYKRWRLNGVPKFVCLINIIALAAVYMVLPLESSVYRTLREHFYYLYPQIKKDRPRFLDPVRIIIQTIFLLFVKQLNKEQSSIGNLSHSIGVAATKYFINPTKKIAERIIYVLHKNVDDEHSAMNKRSNSRVFNSLICLSFISTALAITQPFNVAYQLIFVALMWILAVLLKTVNSRVALLLMIFISSIISTRYMYWRITQTVLLTDFTTSLFSITLLCAEIYAYLVLLLSYFQVCWTLDRKPYPLPEDVSLWPTVDVFIPSYNEPLEVVKPCLLAALDLDWPKDKLKVHMLDDGTRKEFENYCREIGVNYIIRKEHNHAKAGNINHALTLTNGEIIAIFDCDHIPSRAFLQMTVGWMVHDKKIALVQTPHHFYSDDPFEKNLDIKGEVPAENSLFHDFIQKGNDTWNATMFCGSCAIIRRGPLEEIGGIAVETVTEDAHTSLRLNRKGYSSAFLSMPLAAGLATESLADHINQRIRWARGMVQIFRIDNPLAGKGLTLPQRLCFLNAMIHFLHGLPRIIFLLAPLPFLFFNIYVIFASGMMIFAYVLPHIVHSTLTNQKIQGNKRFYFWGVIYETVLSWYITVPTLIALISPKHGKFNVTAKGASNEETYFDWTVSKAYIFIIVLNFLGLFVGIYNIIFDPFSEPGIILINLAWVCYNLLILGAASAVALERRQVRTSPRVNCSMPGKIEFETKDGTNLIDVEITDFSKDGLGIRLPEYSSSSLKINDLLDIGKKVYIHINNNNINYRFECSIRFSSSQKLGLLLNLKTLKENIEYIRTTFACADRWSHSFEDLKQDSLLHGIHTLITFGLNGYFKMLNNVPVGIKQVLQFIISTLILFFSLLPQPLDLSKENPLEKIKKQKEEQKKRSQQQTNDSDSQYKSETQNLDNNGADYAQ